MDLPVTGDKTRPPVVGPLPEADGSSARTLGWHGGSPICAAAFAQIAQGFICQRVETTRRYIFLDLAVPQDTIKLGKPPPEFGKLL